MNVAIGTSHRPSNPLGVVAALCGIAGFATTFALWLYQLRPGSSLLGDYAAAVASGGQLQEDLITLAALLGTVAILGAFLSSLGGPAKTSAVVAILLGAAALTYPVLAWQGIVGVPVAPTSFTGL
jgi:hypothetical protein